MLGQAALAMWWTMAPDMRAEFERWHTQEHFPERLALPGFRRASRWADAAGGDGFFVLYELGTYEALVSPEYLARLNDPTPWSRKLMPHHRDMVRSPSRVLASRGAVCAGHLLTVRLSAASAGTEPQLQAHLQGLVQSLPDQPGVAGAHLLQTELPAIAATTEQKIRGLADRAADRILLVAAHEPAALSALVEGEVSASRLHAVGAAPGCVAGIFSLRLSGLPGELDGSVAPAGG